MNAIAVVTSQDAAERSAVSSQYLTFALGSEVFAAPIENILEVVEFHGLTRIPLAPPTVPGVLNLRGIVIPVVDLSVRFGRTPTSIGRRTCVVVVEVSTEEGTQAIGMLVDAVSEALEVEPSQLEAPPSFGAGIRSDFVAGMLNLGGRFVVVLDMKHVLSMEELERLVTSFGTGRERTLELTRFVEPAG